MARIVIHKVRSGPGGSPGVSDSGDGVDSGVTESTDPGPSQPLRTFTGEPDEFDNRPASNNRKPNRSESGNSTKFVDPSTASSAGDSPSGRRGRKPGSKNKPRGADPTQTTKDIASLLLTAHFALAAMIHAPGLALSQAEADNLGAAITRVTELYDISIIPEKQMAWLNLLLVSGAVYGPRILGLRKPKGKTGPQVVTMPMPPQAQGDGASGSN